jgi:hypothetical protein
VTELADDPLRFDHPVAGFRLALPAGWEAVADPQPGVALIALEPPALADFRTNVVVTVEDVAGLSFEDWQLGCDELLPGSLADYQLLDLERTEGGPGPGVRRLAQHSAGGTRWVTLEQWVTLAGSTGYTLTTTVATARYDACADDLAGIAASLRVGTPDTGGRP